MPMLFHDNSKISFFIILSICFYIRRICHLFHAVLVYDHKRRRLHHAVLLHQLFILLRVYQLIGNVRLFQ